MHVFEFFEGRVGVGFVGWVGVGGYRGRVRVGEGMGKGRVRVRVRVWVG